MSFSEILFRFSELVKGLVSGIFSIKGHPKYFSYSIKPPLLNLNIQLNNSTIEENYNIFGIDFRFGRPFEIDWHRDISSGEKFPLIPARRINILSNDRLSAKYVWEINRLQYLTGICLNYRRTEDNKYLRLFIDINHSWNLQNPYLYGINWRSNIEVNLRLITWFFCWELLDVESITQENDEFRRFVDSEWILMIYQHCLFSFSNPSKYSSANNHLVSEYAGLFVASTKWNFPESEKWNKYSKEGLEKEILKQHSSNGINKEEAAEYIQFITDFFLLAYIVGERSGNPFSDNYRDMLLKIFTYIYDFLDLKGNYPKYGDEDDGKCYVLDYQQDYDNFRSLMTSASIIFKNQMFKSKSSGIDNKNRILFGEQGATTYSLLPVTEYCGFSKFYKEEGHFILRKTSLNHEIFIHFNAAPLGYLSIAAHGHSDALSFVLHIDGQPIFIDSGTYTYHTEKKWRDYFIGTLSHNTVRINYKNQALNVGPTLWVKHYKCYILHSESDANQDRIIATHNGYLKEKVWHVRELCFNKNKYEIKIIDTIEIQNKRRTTVEIPFHISPGTELSFEEDRFMIAYPGLTKKLEFLPDKRLKFEIFKGQSAPFIIGWYSKSFMKKEPVNTIYLKTILETTNKFESIIKII